MLTLSLAQSQQINSAVHTHDWEAEAVASWEATGDDLMDELADRFESQFKDWDTAEELGGITVYLKAGQLVAFYDYEQFKGSVF